MHVLSVCVQFVFGEKPAQVACSCVFDEHLLLYSAQIEKNTNTLILTFQFQFAPRKYLKFQPSVCVPGVCMLIFLSLSCHLVNCKKVMHHFVVFSNTILCKEETAMAVVGVMTGKIYLIRRCMKALYSVTIIFCLANSSSVQRSTQVWKVVGNLWCQMSVSKKYILHNINKIQCSI